MNLDDFIFYALQEDVGPGDYSSLACIPADKKSKAHLLVKEDGIIAGVELSQKIFEKVDKDLKITYHINDGQKIKKGDIVFIAEGSAQSILKAERLVLNCMQRMSGIATKTNNIVNLLEGLNTRVIDTRKTTPNMRLLEKWAVRIGGGSNHRFGLFDMIMLKDNHIDYAGGIRAAIEKTKVFLKEKNLDLKIEVETRNLKELEEVLDVGGIDRVMLDNYSVADLTIAVKMVNKRMETEASGGITEATIRRYAETGVDFISVGALTHSVKSLDLSLKAIN